LANMTPEQCRAARALLKWPQVRLASKAGMGESIIRDFESGNRVPNPSKMIAIRRALEAAGILFVSDGQQIAGSLGVRLKAAGSPQHPLTEGEAGIIANSEM